MGGTGLSVAKRLPHHSECESSRCKVPDFHVSCYKKYDDMSYIMVTILGSNKLYT